MWTLALLLLLQDAPLSFEISDGANHNVFYQDRNVAYHIRLTDLGGSRVIIALPAGNSGIALTFNPETKWSIAESRPWTSTGGIRGADVLLRANGDSVVLDQAILDNVRLLRTSAFRSYPEHVAARLEVAKLLGIDPDGWADNRVTLHRNAIDFERHTLHRENAYKAGLEFSGDVKIEPLSGGRYRVTRLDGRPVEMRVRAGSNYTSLTPFPVHELLTPEALHLYRTSKDPQLVESINALRFLSYKEKFLAGSHRYNTYFGRDTMLTAMLAGPMLTPQAREAALKSVLDRISPEGIVAHEEDIGGQAERRRIEEALKDPKRAREILRNPQAPIYDYKMVDGEALLMLLVRQVGKDFFERNPQYKEPMRRAVNRLIADASAYARDPKATNLIGFKEGTVGDWRDSNAGNGLGRYAGSVNAELVPEALRAIRDLGLGPDLTKSWDNARQHFLVELTADEARVRLNRYLSQVPPEVRRYYEAQKVAPNATLGQWLRGQAKAPELDHGVKFSAIALDAQGKPIPILTSDVALSLYFGNPTPQQVRELLQPLRRPFPLGLRTEVGTAVASPALSDRPGDYKMFNRGRYHGAVIWGWQESLIKLGLMRQAERMRTLDPQLHREIVEVLHHANRAHARAGKLSNAELWSFEVKDGQVRAIPYRPAPDLHSESNPVQLWSTVGPAVQMAKSYAKQEAVGAARFAAAYVLKEAMMGRFGSVRDLKEPAFWTSLAEFTGGSKLAEFGLHKLNIGGALTRAAVPLAVGMGVVQVMSGHLSVKDLLISTAAYTAAGFAVSFLADGLLYPLLFAAGPPGWITAGLYTVGKLAVTLYVGEKIEGWLHGLFGKKKEEPRREGFVETIEKLGK